MFILDSLMISGLRWVMSTVVTAAEAEMNDDSALREQLLDAEMRRELAEISDDEYQEIEADILGRIRAIKERRDGGSGSLTMGDQPIETTGDSRFQIEASVAGDFHEPAEAPHTTIIETNPRSGEQIAVLDMEPGQAEEGPAAGLPLESKRPPRARRAAARRKRSASHRKLRKS